MKRRRWTRRLLGTAFGLTLGWLAAGYAQSNLPAAAPADPPATQPEMHEDIPIPLAPKGGEGWGEGG